MDYARSVTLGIKEGYFSKPDGSLDIDKVRDAQLSAGPGAIAAADRWAKRNRLHNRIGSKFYHEMVLWLQYGAPKWITRLAGKYISLSPSPVLARFNKESK